MNTIIKYLKELEANNNREWYHANKNEFKQANAEFESIISEIMIRLGQIEPDILRYEPRELTFKIVRDTRFSNDKSPYNPSFRCHISTQGKLPIPVGYYLQIKPYGNSFFGGGLFADMFKDATQLLRDYLYDNVDEYESIINDSEFASVYKVKGQALKKVPNGYDPNHKAAEYVKYKSLYIEDFFNDELLNDTDAFINFAIERFTLMKPFNDFLNKALKGFTMPTR